MSDSVILLNSISAYGGLAMLFATAILIFDLYTTRTLAALVQRYATWGLVAASVAGVALTLVYSEIFGFVPCGLCWLQRMFLYPLPLILGTGLWLRDARVYAYTMVLATPGAMVALYQHYLQMGGIEFVGCPAAAGDCAQRILFEFGFMTFPLLSGILFAFLFVVSFYSYKLS